MSVGVESVGGTLHVEGTSNPDQIQVIRILDEVVVKDSGSDVARVPFQSVNAIEIVGGAENDEIFIFSNINIKTTISGNEGDDSLIGSSGGDILIGGPGIDKLVGNGGFNFYAEGENLAPLPGLNLDLDTGLFLGNQVVPSAQTDLDGNSLTLNSSEVRQLLDRASAASPSDDAIIAIVDRGGRILGVRVEDGVSQSILLDPTALTFAIDGALAKARTGAFFANDTAPLTSRTVQALSESTILQREVESNPNFTEPNSTQRGPGTVARIGIGGHFPRNVNFTPQVDLAQIEHTNRDTTFHPGQDRIKGTADDIELPNRFNIPDEAIPDRLLEQDLFIKPPDSYGFVSGLLPGAQPRGVSTLPGGLPILRAFKTEIKGIERLRASIIGGLGVFFPGDTGFAIEENSTLNGLAYDPEKRDRSQEAEAIAIAALGGVIDVTKPSLAGPLRINDLGGVPRVDSIVLPLGRIDLVGITLPIYGGHGFQGIRSVQIQMARLGISATGSRGTVNGVDLPVTTGADGVPGTGDEESVIPGQIVPEGFLVEPQDAQDGGLTRGDVIRLTAQAIAQANQTRAAIRLPLDESTRMIIAVTYTQGNVIGLYRMPDATYFSLDVAVAKARNVAYYADSDKLQEVDHLPGVPRGAAFTNRTIRYASLPFFPSGQDNYPPGPFSKLNDGQVSVRSALNSGPPLPATAFQSVGGFDAFNPQTNFRDPTNILNQNGIVFFPGSAPIYKDIDGDGVRELVGGLGISGDGIDQDDVVTYYGSKGYEPPFTVPRADQTKFRNVRLPYIKFNRQPLNRQFEIPQPSPVLEGIGPLP
ncbi:heme-binding protein [Tautonia plasticadhaerens]|uniref:heme-binding protein n=1 Tax=Tautonia plasticadhaerens TaxID=2527974 RepID=UPI00119DE4FF|nr:heme-binding protein [Tautonia plasticadhaerens]